jgi:alkanesulfonate monooxygenase SsuD/methylene tetrahydromethanopterin reductase-like flavin-dependent oxidoreductase (luciferase family)
MFGRIGRERGWPPRSKEQYLEEVRSGSLHVGSPETVARKVAGTLHALGAQRFDLKYSNGPLPHSRLLRSIELYATEVVPRVRALLHSSDA